MTVESYRDTLRLHSDYVRRVVPKERLLVMSVKDGWAPLCNFLNKPQPSTPFPHANEAGAIAKVMPRILMKVLGMWIGIAGATGVAGWYAWKSGVLVW